MKQSIDSLVSFFAIVSAVSSINQQQDVAVSSRVPIALFYFFAVVAAVVSSISQQEDVAV